MKKIQLSKGQEAIVDDDDFVWLNQWKWHLHSRYAARTEMHGSAKTKIYMHRLIMATPLGEYTDHINGDGLDNQRMNLRTCSQSENMQNASPKKGKFKGVIKRTDHNSFMAQIALNGDTFYLGNFSTDVEAARAYDKKALELFGKFARLNFPINGAS